MSESDGVKSGSLLMVLRVGLIKKQYLKIGEDDYSFIDSKAASLSSDLVEYITDEAGLLMTIPLGSSMNFCEQIGHQFEGISINSGKEKHT